MFPHIISLSEDFHRLDMSNRGLEFDKTFKRIVPNIFVPEERDSPYDFSQNAKYFDLKLITDKNEERDTEYVYLSHNEYLFAKQQQDFFYVVYREIGVFEEAHLTCVFTFEYAKEVGAMEVFANGKKVFCHATGKPEMPWSINVTRLQEFLTHDIEKGKKFPEPWYNSNTLLKQQSKGEKMGQPAEVMFKQEPATEVEGRPIDDLDIQKLIGPNFESRSHWVSDIAEMHTKFGVNPVIRNLKKEQLKQFLQFRIDFLQEELDELNDALNDPDFKKDRADETVDALIDLCVVAIGTLNAFDVDAYEAWSRVHEKNMQKEVGVNPNRSNPLGLPDLVKPKNWTAPSHLDNVGLLKNVFD